MRRIQTAVMHRVLSRYILFVYLLPVFFVLHGFNEYYDLIPVNPALRLTFWYLLACTVLLLLFRFLFRDTVRAGLMTCCIMSYQFFFGSLQDLLERAFPGSFLVRYSFILPVSLAVFIAVFVFLRRSKRKFARATLYLNALLLLFLLLDAGLLAGKIMRSSTKGVIPATTLTRCDTCATPDIYLVVADGYPGNNQFRDLLGYDNSRFDEALRQRGFHITDSSISNYNFTFFSIGSMLSLNYLNHVEGSIRNKINLPAGRKAYRNNIVTGFLEKQGYSFHNFSSFDFKDHPTKAKPTFWINDTRPLVQQTFLFRLFRDLGFHLVTKFRMKPFNSYPPDQDLKNNNQLFGATIELARAGSSSPRFVYTHLTMPHHPYYFDSTGKAVPLQDLTKEFAFNKKAAVSYIVYANKKYLELVDTILAHATKPPIILLISDHGFREIREKQYRNTMFLNLNAVLLPGGDYTGFFKGMSNVNLFRLILNSQFQQRLPLLKDSTIFIED